VRKGVVVGTDHLIKVVHYVFLKVHHHDNIIARPKSN
jgi:hypothetical protein